MPSGRFTNCNVGDVIGAITITTMYKRSEAWRIVGRCSVCGNEAYDGDLNELRRRQRKLERLHPGEKVACGCQMRCLQAKAHTLPDAKSYKKSYHVWRMMVKRCNDPGYQAYPNYGGRGIEVCERWMNYANFVADMGEPPPKHDLERKNNALGYSKDNCGWRTRRRNANNRRVNRHITVNGIRYTYAQASRKFGISHSTIAWRDKRGITGSALVAQPYTGYTYVRQNHEKGL